MNFTFEIISLNAYNGKTIMDTPQLFANLKSPFILVIFGATGDLTQNKLIPALFALYREKKLPEDFFIIGFSRRELNDGQFHEHFKDQTGKKEWDEFKKHLSYQSGSFENEERYKELIGKILEIDKKMGACIARFFYLATPPDHYGEILEKLVTTKLSEGCGDPSIGSGQANKNGWTRLIIEKPFGKDLETARRLDKRLSEIFEEKQIFRVDHYLGKETVQNLLAFRFANNIFEPTWNSEYIDHIQITFAEKGGIGARGRFFDGVGMLRDVGQNHLMQLLAAVAMEMPNSFTKEDVRNERSKVINSLKISSEPNSVVWGEYMGYRDEKNVAEKSDTETFVAMKLFVGTPRFENVPFYVRAGKKMAGDVVQISVVFRQTCHILFKEYGCPEIGNVLMFRIQPNEGINLRFIAKSPGDKLSLQPVNMHFNNHEGFGTKGLEAYEKILLDIFAGDQLLFNRSDELASSWRFINEVLEKWGDKEVELYKPGSWGPESAEDMIRADNRMWIT